MTQGPTPFSPVRAALEALQDAPAATGLPGQDQMSAIAKDMASAALGLLADDLVAEAGRQESQGGDGPIRAGYLRLAAVIIRDNGALIG